MMRSKRKSNNKQLLSISTRYYEWGSADVGRQYFDLPEKCLIKGLIFNVDPNSNKGTDVLYEITIYTLDTQRPTKYNILPNKYNNINLKINRGGITVVLIEEPYEGYLTMYFEK